ncbi:MAG: 2-oxoglutarate and iron-dependent oxygenase domain-containing protein, partial [Aeromonas sp.]|nr:2-oxoglutarate and iron-dependent oxygenase domain-containing protein [Aeromonas sp.]
MTTPSLPIIDLAALKGTPAARSQMLAQLGQAAREVGFFYLVGHDLSESARQETLALAARFFALPLEEKLAVQMVHSPHFRGYNQVGAELTRARPDLREQFDIMNEAQALPVAHIREPWQRLIGP